MCNRCSRGLGYALRPRIPRTRKIPSASLRRTIKSGGLRISRFDSVIGISGTRSPMLRLGANSPEATSDGRNRRNQRQRDRDRNERAHCARDAYGLDVRYPAKLSRRTARRSSYPSQGNGCDPQIWISATSTWAYRSGAFASRSSCGSASGNPLGNKLPTPWPSPTPTPLNEKQRNHLH